MLLIGCKNGERLKPHIGTLCLNGYEYYYMNKVVTNRGFLAPKIGHDGKWVRCSP